MLKGTVKYITSDTKAYTYNVEAIDTSTMFSMKLSSFNANAIEKMQGEDDDNSGYLEERRFDVSLAHVVVETNTYTENNKTKKHPVNTDLFCRLGALIRYAKMQCTAQNEVGYTGLRLASKEFEAVTSKEYVIPYTHPTLSGKIYARVRLSYGDIISLDIDSPSFVIHLDSDNGETDLFKPIKNGQKLGIKFDEEYLGFPIKAQEIEVIPSNNGMYTCIEDIVKAHPDKEFSWLLEKDYKIVDDEHLEEICNYILDDKWEYVYYDTETTGLNINFKSRIGQADQLVGVVLSVKYGESFFFPTQMKSIPNLCGGDHFYFMEKYMRPILEGKKLVAHNMSFDWKVAYIYDINANIVHDTMALIKLTIGAERKNYPIGLKENARLLLGRDSLELSDLVVDNSWGQSEIRFWDLPYELVRLYACADTDNTKGLLDYAVQTDLLNRYNATKVYEIEIAFSFAVAYQEFYGHHIDVNNLSEIREEIRKGQDECMKKMEEIVGREFNPNSPKVLLDIMYNQLGIPTQISRKTGKPTTDKETLKYLAELTDAEDNTKYPFCKLLQKYREYEGIRKTVDKFPEYMTADGYLFSSVMQYGTTTGRVSINKPNYQSYNDPIKKNVIPRPGYWMFDTDYSSVEYRVLGNMVGNKRIMDNFRDPDFDYHAYQAAHMYNVPYSAVTKKLRKAAKSINFGLPYGMGDESLGAKIFGEATPENTRKAAALRQAYFKGQEDIRDWFEYHRNRGVNEGFTETYFGRRRYYHKQDFSAAKIRRQAGNQIIQGCQTLDTHILTQEFGIVRLGDILNLNVTVWTGTGWSNSSVLPAGNKRKTILKFKGGQTMICSPNHKFLVSTKRGNAIWVEAQDLHTLEKYKNPHRIIVNQRYAVASNSYVSDRCYDSDANRAVNYYLDDMKDSYAMGVFLGRTASDGHQTLHHTGSNAIVNIIAEHEYNILPELRQYLSCYNFTERRDGTRTDRNEEITRLSVYSTSLSKEIDSLDIRHHIDKRIFADTEMLRGFLCGYFDGDGGISGKTITCVFGKQDDFSQLVKDMQIALLFFGVRSRIREYDDRWVLQIKTNDNSVFLKEIGFLNKDKQDKGNQLVCLEDEHTFGKCLIPESVEVTDELIPMADVCNTDGGYYVADGLITHNTAADIYKTAVGRVFKRVCKEGWLGKVLFTGFIHDELLGEVSNDIDPAYFLKVLREEFEVKITNSDGTPWSPLYMGFGYGMSWYEAKSVELPIKLQWEIVEKYAETGFPEWHGDGRAFCDTIPDKLRDFEVRDIRNQLLDPASQGKEIKPTLNNQVLDCVKEDSKLYAQGISEYMTSHNITDAQGIDRDDLISYLDKTYHIQGLLTDEGNNLITSFEPTKETQPAITLYCKLHATDRDKINISDIVEVDSSASNVADAEFYVPEYYDDDDLSPESQDYETRLQQIKDTKVDTLGMYIDIDKKEVTLKVVPANYMAFIQSRSNKEGRGYRIYFKDSVKKQMFVTTSYLDSQEINIIQQMYIQYLTQKR